MWEPFTVFLRWWHNLDWLKISVPSFSFNEFSHYSMKDLDGLQLRQIKSSSTLQWLHLLVKAPTCLIDFTSRINSEITVILYLCKRPNLFLNSVCDLQHNNSLVSINARGVSLLNDDRSVSSLLFSACKIWFHSFTWSNFLWWKYLTNVVGNFFWTLHLTNLNHRLQHSN